MDLPEPDIDAEDVVRGLFWFVPSFRLWFVLAFLVLLLLGASGMKDDWLLYTVSAVAPFGIVGGWRYLQPRMPDWELTLPRSVARPMEILGQILKYVGLWLCGTVLAGSLLGSFGFTEPASLVIAISMAMSAILLTVLVGLQRWNRAEP
ncbi:hypothetical protein ACFSM5_10025 [Lacibacterium aquatile]|uniref:Uncharacterized protein n=1 Tax=Lacibacterium aquatile TaxID=1168082 RepID=A0ABW5DQL7_9PROT